MTDIEQDESTKARGSGLWYVAAGAAVLVSTDTSWRFFGERLGITWLPERIALFTVLELAGLAAGMAMHANVKRFGTPGTSRLIAWALCGAAAYMAIMLSGPAEGVARVTLGPVLALVALHQALGIVLKARNGVRNGTVARIGRELRERALSRIGLGDDGRDALQRTRDRAADRAAWIASQPAPRRSSLRRALRKAGAANNPAVRLRIAEARTVYGSVDSLLTLSADSPWTTPSTLSVPRPPRPSNAPTSGGPAVQWDVAKVVRLLQEGRTDTDITEATSVSAKNLQRVRRVVRAVAGGADLLDVAKGDITPKFAQSIISAMGAE